MTITPFVPSPTSAFEFQAQLDGATYNVIVMWNAWAQRWYINIYDQNQTLVLVIARVGSPPGVPVSLVAGYFTSTLVYWDVSQQFEVLP